MYNSSVHKVTENKLYETQNFLNKDQILHEYICNSVCSGSSPHGCEVKGTVSKPLSELTAMGWGSAQVKYETRQAFVVGQVGCFCFGYPAFAPPNNSVVCEIKKLILTGREPKSWLYVLSNKE